ncbi:hypothetical protein BDZ97DRAFT_1240501 [Flammula alnicola]|nr:hypothetical protein BDZ97DRAFT_1240501 [Flammula alnicola]
MYRHSPNWFSESTDVIIYSLQENLEFEVLNQHRIIKPSLIGLATFSLGILDVEPRMIGEERAIHAPKNPVDVKGTLLFDVFYYPVLFSSFSSSSNEEGIQLSNAGIVTLRIQQAKDFIWEDYLPAPSKLVATASLGWADAPIHVTAPSYFTGQAPVWNSAFDFICFEKTSTTIVIKIVDGEDHCCKRPAALYGHVSVALDELLEAQDDVERERGWWPLSGCPRGALRMTAHWKPIEMNRNRIYRPSSF